MRRSQLTPRTMQIRPNVTAHDVAEVAVALEQRLNNQALNYRRRFEHLEAEVQRLTAENERLQREISALKQLFR